MKKNVATILLTLFSFLTVIGCPICEKQQPKLLRGITHGVGPQSNWDWVIVGIIAIITLLTFFYSIKYLIFPGEKSTTHIKHNILNQF